MRYFERIQPFLQPDDDPEFWCSALAVILGDAAFLAKKVTGSKRPVFVELGRCSHWLRPHQTRWTADGGFAWPTGYDGGRYARSGLPEFDWSIVLKWLPTRQEWSWVVRILGKRPLVLRVALPARTAQHHQAAVHTIWTPGPPPQVDEKLIQFYGFRKQPEGWQHTAYDGWPKEAQERAYG